MFAYDFLKKPKQVGAILPSSAKLAWAMTENISLENARNIAELGAGTGAFTKQILRKKSAAASFFAVEIDTKMATKLAARFENLDIEAGRAQDLRAFLQRRNLGRLDAVVSGIPWTFLSEREQDELLGIIRECLNDGGCFTTFIYAFCSPIKRRRFARKLRAFFSELSTPKIVWKNIPPAFVYQCRK